MNITKYLILFFLTSVSIFISSQEQQGNFDILLNSAGIQETDLDGGFRVVKNDMTYDCQGKPCEGFQTDYYNSDETKIRITGRFKEGMPVDTIKEYYENGILKSLYYPYKRKYKYCGRKYNYCLYIEYDEQGNCIRYTNDKEGIERKYRSDGALISVMYYCRRRSNLKYFVQNFPGSKMKSIITKGNKYDYDENERLRRHWVRKSAKYDKKSGVLSATFYFEEYDVAGNLSRIGRFYSNLYEHDQWLRVSPEFPVEMDSVPVQDFKEIIYPRLNLKDVYRWDYINNKTIIERYEQKGEVWVEIERKSLPRSKQIMIEGYK
ncbi:MAG: hypothetical protein LBV74_08335 [Tannerella sp.]|jgi:hypothetical protein|nr:hypothetical protein [Tannerella sp.]